MKTMDCPCGSGKRIQECCGKWIAGRKKAPTAEALMRSRYTAYVLEDVDYLVEKPPCPHRGIARWPTISATG